MLADAIAAEDPLGFWLGVAIAAGLAAWLLHRGRRAFWRLRLIVDTPTARIRSAPQGYVEFQGRALPLRGELQARLTGTPCVWYRWRIEEHQGRSSGGRRGGHWVTRDHGDAGRPFLIDDGTGQAEVAPADAYLHLRARERWQGPHPDRRAATRGNAITRFFERQRRYRMTEERIHASEPVYILGHFETPRRGVREREALTRTLLARWKRDPERMQRFDLDGDGSVDLDEWERARRQAARLAARAENQLSAEAPRPRVVAADDPAQPFVVSTEDEPTLLARLRLTAFGGLIGGALLGAGSVAVVVARFA
jgi:hypothetical protein